MIIVLIMIINSAIINKNVRDMEVNDGLEMGMEYALDNMEQVYCSVDYDPKKEEEYINYLMEEFCESLREVLDSNGTVIVNLVDVDLSQGYFRIVVEEHYSYGFQQRKGKCVCERAVRFYRGL